jgi:hypothetical protein
MDPTNVDFMFNRSQCYQVRLVVLLDEASKLDHLQAAVHLVILRAGKQIWCVHAGLDECRWQETGEYDKATEDLEAALQLRGEDDALREAM